MKTITIRLDKRLTSLLKENMSKTGASQSEIVRKALENHLLVQRFEHLRQKAMPFAEAQGILTDEDVFKAIS